MQIPNIYAYKNLKMLVLIPIALMFIGLYLSQFIVYDVSLSGGISITIQPNATVNIATLQKAISQKFGIAASVSPGTSGITITLPSNSSIAAAEASLVNFYTYSANYSAYLFNYTSASLALQRQPNNQTLMSSVSAASSGLNASLSGMRSTLSTELSLLKPFIGSVQYNASDPSQMSSIAAAAYANATGAYTRQVINSVRSVVPFSSYKYEPVTPTLSRFFLSQVETVLIVSFILISITVFIIFRSVIPSLAIIFGAGNDIIIALGLMGLFRIPLGVASLGGLLMLIGYSIDTELLTSIRILKRHEGAAEERAYSAMRTGLTMTSTAIVAFAVLFAVSWISGITTYFEISGVVLFGLIGDIFTTWFGNAPMVLIYKKRKERGLR